MEKSPDMAQLPAFVPVTALSSERMLGAITGRAGSQVSHSLRSLQFADRVLGHFLRVMGLEGAEAPAAVRERPTSPMSWIFPSPWYDAAEPAQVVQRRRLAQPPAPALAAPAARPQQPAPAQPEVVAALPSTTPAPAERGASIGLPQVAAPLAERKVEAAAVQGQRPAAQAAVVQAAPVLATAAQVTAAQAQPAQATAPEATAQATAQATAPEATAQATAPEATAQATAQASAAEERRDALVGEATATISQVAAEARAPVAASPATPALAAATAPAITTQAPGAVGGPPTVAVAAAPAQSSAPQTAPAITDGPRREADAASAAPVRATAALAEEPATPARTAATTSPGLVTLTPAAAPVAEPRVIDLLGPQAPPHVAPASAGPSALGRAFAHLRWTDDRLSASREPATTALPSGLADRRGASPFGRREGGLLEAGPAPGEPDERPTLAMPMLDPAEAAAAPRQGRPGALPAARAAERTAAAAQPVAQQPAAPVAAIAPAMTLAIPFGAQPAAPARPAQPAATQAVQATTSATAATPTTAEAAPRLDAAPATEARGAATAVESITSQDQVGASPRAEAAAQAAGDATAQAAPLAAPLAAAVAPAETAAVQAAPSAGTAGTAAVPAPSALPVAAAEDAAAQAIASPQAPAAAPGATPALAGAGLPWLAPPVAAVQRSPGLGLAHGLITVTAGLGPFADAATPRREGGAAPIAEGAPSLPLLSPIGGLAERFVQQLSGWQAAQDAQMLPVPTHRPFAGSLEWLRPGEAPAAARAAAATTRAGLATGLGGREPIAPEQSAGVAAPALTLLTPEGRPVQATTALGPAPAGTQAAIGAAQPSTPAFASPGGQGSAAAAALAAVPGTGAELPARRPALAPDAAPAAAGLEGAAVSGRPGGIGSSAERFGTAIGVRAAGLATEFVDPQALQALSLSLGGAVPGAPGQPPLTPAQAAMLAGGLGRGERVLAPLLAQLVAASEARAPGGTEARWQAALGLPLLQPAAQAGAAQPARGADAAAPRGATPLAAERRLGAAPTAGATAEDLAATGAALPLVQLTPVQEAMRAAQSAGLPAARAPLGATGLAASAMTTGAAPAPAAAAPGSQWTFGGNEALPWAALSLFPAAARALLAASKLGPALQGAGEPGQPAAALSPDELPSWPLVSAPASPSPTAATARPGATAVPGASTPVVSGAPAPGMTALAPGGAPFTPAMLASLAAAQSAQPGAGFGPGAPFVPTVLAALLAAGTQQLGAAQASLAPEGRGAPLGAGSLGLVAGGAPDVPSRWAALGDAPRTLLSGEAPAARAAQQAPAASPSSLGAQAMALTPLWSSLTGRGPEALAALGAGPAAGSTAASAAPAGIAALWRSLFPTAGEPTGDGGAAPGMGSYPLLQMQAQRAAAPFAAAAAARGERRPAAQRPDIWTPLVAGRTDGWPETSRQAEAQGGAWEPPAAVRAALSATAGSDRGLPMWEAMEPVDLDVVEDAFDDHQASDHPDRKRRDHAGRGGRPTLSVLEGGAQGGQARRPLVPPAAGAGPAWRRQSEETTLVTAPIMAAAARPTPSSDPSSKLIDAVRAHASAQATASDDRITLGDLTLIAIAAGQDQVAAASSGNAPASVQNDDAVAGQPLKGESKEDRSRMVFQVQHLVRQILDEIAFKERMDDERHGEQ